jgi:hypothetical protein
MAKIKPEELEKELKKKGTFIFQRIEALGHLMKGLEKEFAKSPEGKEVFYLKSLLEHYINKIENFLVEFITGEPGKRGIDHVIQGLEHPASEVKPDKKLIDELKKLSEEVKKIKAEKTPRMVEFENFEFAVVIWKFILSRIYRPDQETKARHIIGPQRFEEIDRKIAEKLNIDVGKFKKEFAACFPKEKEDENMTNLIAFANKVANERNDNIFIKLLREVGQKRYADLLIKQFGKKGAVKTDPKTVNAIANLITRIDNKAAKEKVKAAAKKELETALGKERDKFAKVINARIKELEKKFAKDLAELRKMYDDLSSAGKEIIKAKVSAANYAKKIDDLEKSRYDYNIRASDILLIQNAQVFFRLFMTGDIDEAKLNSKIDAIIAKKPSEFAVKAINGMRERLRARKPLKEFDDFITKLVAQMPSISAYRQKTAKEIERIVPKIKDAQHVLKFYLTHADAKALQIWRKLHKMGIKLEMYRETLRPEEIEMLRAA